MMERFISRGLICKCATHFSPPEKKQNLRSYFIVSISIRKKREFCERKRSREKRILCKLGFADSRARNQNLLQPSSNLHQWLQAYECLSDKGRRKAFNSDRKNNYCKECHRKSQQYSVANKNHKDAAPQAKQHKLIRALKEVQNRLREECKVIENCLRANEAAGRTESPLFDPSDRLHFPDYPHYYRDRVYFSNFSCSSDYRKARCELPVYQIRTGSRRSWRKNPGFRF